jgi:dTDP-4-dehydrorhamnose reductase
MRVVVTGAAGQLGSAVVEELRPSHDIIALTRRELDVADDAAVATTMDRLQPDVIVNCVAYNFVDLAEDHPIDALSANAFAVRALARAAQRRDAALVHYSTDFVFDGTASLPYTESDRPRPQSVYASSKLLGEWFALDAPRGYVLRVESLFGGAAAGPEPKGSFADLRDRCGARHAAARGVTGRRGALSLREFGIVHLVRVREGAGAPAWRRTVADPGPRPRRSDARRASAVLRAV